MPGPDDPQTYRVEVPLRWSDMDAYGHVNNVQYLRLLEDARVIGFRSWFPDRPTMLDEGIVVTRHVIEYRSPLTYRAAPVEVDMWVTRVHGAGFDLGYTVRDPESGREAGVRDRRDRAGPLRLRERPPAPARPRGAHPARGARRRAGALPLGRPVTGVLRLTDPQSLADLGTFAARARAVDAEGAMRLQASGAVLAAWVGVLPGSGILAEGTVLGLRTFALAEPADLDVTVPLGAVTDRTARGPGTDLRVPPTRVVAPWSAVTPPRGPWEPRRLAAG